MSCFCILPWIVHLFSEAQVFIGEARNHRFKRSANLECSALPRVQQGGDDDVNNIINTKLNRCGDDLSDDASRDAADDDGDKSVDGGGDQDHLGCYDHAGLPPPPPPPSQPPPLPSLPATAAAPPVRHPSNHPSSNENTIIART